MRKLFNISIINLKTKVASVASEPRAVTGASFVCKIGWNSSPKYLTTAN